jgi:flagellar basal-body rod protein FlgC
MSFFNALNISATGLTAQRLRMDLISQNIANVNTTRTAEGGPYRRKAALFEEIGGFDEEFAKYLGTTDEGVGGGVRISGIVPDGTPSEQIYSPNHPDANNEGYLLLPNVNIVEEMVDMIAASRSYEANVTVIGSTKQMIAKTMEIGRT